MARATLLAIAAVATIGCRPAPAPAVSNTASPRAIQAPWQLVGSDLVDVTGDRVILWDRGWNAGRGGLAEYSALDGAYLRTRTIDGLAVNGGLHTWQPVAGGVLAFWDGPALVATRGDALAVAWRAPGDDWFASHAVVGDGVVIGRGRASAAVVRLALGDGHEQWSVALGAGVQDVVIREDGAAVYASWRDPAGTRRVRALEPASGRTLWTRDLADEPGALAVAHGTIVATIGSELQLIDGASGKIRTRLGLSGGYPTLRVDRDRVYVALREGVTAIALSGASLWTAAVALDGGPRLAIAGDDVVVSTASGSVVALARASGERRWEIGVGLQPARLIATPAALVAYGGERVVGFALPPAMRAETARLRGRVIANACGPIEGAIVTIAGTRVAIDATGHYHAEIVARGMVTVSVTAARRMSSSGGPSTAAIRLDGRGDYEVPDLAPSACDASG